VSGTKEELVARVENAKQAGVETVVERAARENGKIAKRAKEAEYAVLLSTAKLNILTQI